MVKRIILRSTILLAIGAGLATAAMAQAPAGGAPGTPGAAGGGRGGGAAGAGAAAPGAAGGRGGGARGPTAPAPGVAPALPGVIRAEFPPERPELPAGFEAYAGQGIPLPSPGHVPFVLPKDITGWTGQEGMGNQQYNIVGSLNGAGPYMQLLKWWPGYFSTPHYHTQERYIVVLSGTWWGSSSSVQDKGKTFPLPAGTVVRDTACTIHWDGSRATDKEPVVILIYGMGPAGNVNVDADGNPTRPIDPADTEGLKCAANAKATSHTFEGQPAVPAAGGTPAAAAGGGRGGGGRGGQ